MADYLTPMVNNDKEYRKLKREYLKAVEEKKTEFDFHGQSIIVKFAYYWLIAIEKTRLERKFPNAIFGKEIK